MELLVEEREVGKKSFLKDLRKRKKIPAKIYSSGENGQDIFIDGFIFIKFLNSLETGTLSSKIFTLISGKKQIKAIIKDIQYHVVTYDVLHLDFLEIKDNVPVVLNIPIKFTNIVDCSGVKLGGVLRQVIYSVKVKCLPQHIVPALYLDVKDLSLSQCRKLSDIEIPKNMKTITPLKEVVVTIAKR